MPLDVAGLLIVGQGRRVDAGGSALHVIVRGLNGSPPSWSIESSDGQRIGMITEAVRFGFVIHAAHGTELRRAHPGPYESLEATIQEIGACLRMPCLLRREGAGMH